MKNKKILTVISSLFLVAALLFPSTVQAALQSGQTTMLTINIPATHEVTLVIGEHGFVQVKEQEYRGKQTVAIDRLSEQSYRMQADDGWEIDTVSYGTAQEPQAVTPVPAIYTAPAITTDDNILTVTFKQSDEKKAQAVRPSSLPKTGDGTTVFFYFAALTGAALVLLIVLHFRKLRKQVDGC